MTEIKTGANHALAQCLAPALLDTTQVIENQSCFIKFTTSLPALMPVRNRCGQYFKIGTLKGHHYIYSKLS